MIGKLKRRFPSDFIFIIILIAIVSYIYSFLFAISPLSIVGDAQRYNGYQAYVVKYSLTHFGQLGLWDQFLSSGMSWISHPGGGLLSPVAWIATFLTSNVTRGSLLIFYIHALTASLSYYFLFRVLGLRKITGFLVALLAVSNQYIFIFAVNGWFEEFFDLTLIPLTVGFLWLAMTRKRWFYVIIGALVMSLNFFSNSYYVFHYNAIILLWIGMAFLLREIWLIIKSKKNNNDFAKLILYNIVFWVLLIGISAIKLLPLLEFRSISARNYSPLSVIETPDGVMTFSFFKSLISNYIIPAGHTDSFTHWSNDLAIFFIILSVIYFLFRKSFKYGLFLSIFIMGMWGYFAYRLPVDFYALLYKFLPGFNSNNYPYRFVIIITLAFFVCLGLGLDILIRQKNKILMLTGLLLGTLVVIGAVKYTKISYDSVSYPKMVDIKNDLSRSSFNVIKGKDITDPPKIQGVASRNLISNLTKIVKEYKPEGRVYSTVSSINGNALINQVILEEGIPTVQHSYDPIVPTYEFAIIRPGNVQDDLILTKERYKIFSVLDVRFQMQDKQNFEYAGCNKLSLPNYELTINKKLSNEVCNFLELRLSQIMSQKEGGIFYDSKVLPKVSIISLPILLIGDNSFNDYSAFMAKQILFHPDFNENKFSVLSGGSSYLDDYQIGELNKFPVILLSDTKIKNKKKSDQLLDEYRKNGGRVISLTGRSIKYDDLHDRSGSIFTDKPAWMYSDNDSKILSDLFKSFPEAGTKNSISIKKFTPEDLLFQAQTTKDNQVLQFSDSFYPGWKATIDGKNTNVYMADGLVKGVVVSVKGTHLVRFYYSPDSFKKGAIISGITLSALFLMLLIEIVRRKNLWRNSF